MQRILCRIWIFKNVLQFFEFLWIRRKSIQMCILCYTIVFFFLNWIPFYFFHFFENIVILCLFIVFWLGSDRPLGLFFRPRVTYFHTLVSILTFFVCYLFHSCCSNARVFGKTLLHEFLVSCSHTEWYLLFSDSITIQANILYWERKRRNASALVNHL